MIKKIKKGAKPVIKKRAATAYVLYFQHTVKMDAENRIKKIGNIAYAKEMGSNWNKETDAKKKRFYDESQRLQAELESQRHEVNVFPCCQ